MGFRAVNISAVSGGMEMDGIRNGVVGSFQVIIGDRLVGYPQLRVVLLATGLLLSTTTTTFTT